MRQSPGRPRFNRGIFTLILTTCNSELALPGEPADFYQKARADWMQGDIVSFAPAAAVRDDIDLLREHNMSGGRSIYARYRLSLGGKNIDETIRFGNTRPYNFDKGNLHIGSVTYRFPYGIVLTHSCDIENEDVRTLALVRETAPITNPEDLETIRNNHNYNYFFLPSHGGSGMPEGYIDLRYITTIKRRILEGCDRTLSLSDSSLRSLYGQWFLCLTHMELLREIVERVEIPR